LSYDLTLFHVTEGVDVELAYRQLMERQESEIIQQEDWLKRPVSESARTEMRRLADALRSWRPELREFQPKSPLPWIELDDEQLEIQIHVYEQTVSITMPYFREPVQEMMKCVAGCLQIVEATADYVAYDPQLGRIVAAADLGEMVAQYRYMGKARAGILPHTTQSSTPARKPWWKIW